MAYQPGIPTGLVDLDQDYQNIQDNFQALNNVYQVDHLAYDNVSPVGYHKAIRMVPQAVPAAIAGYGQLFSQTVTSVASDTALYWLTGGNRLSQLTMNIAPVAAQDGYTYLPGGILMQWARFSPTTNFSPPNITFPIAFPNACFLVILQGDDGTTATQNLLVTAKTTTTFSYLSLNSPGKFYTYLAIGN